jgi:hypothetical protein
MTRVKFGAVAAAVAIFTSVPPFDANNAMAQARLIMIDKLITKEKMEYARAYLDGIDPAGATIFADEFEGLSIVRIESAKSCLNSKCLTIVIHVCAKEPCPYVRVLADRSVYANPLYVELFGGLRSITFGNPVSPGPIVVFGNNLMIVAAGP